MSLNPEEVSRNLQEHFANISSSEFKDNVKDFCPEISERSSMEKLKKHTQENKGQLLLFHSQPSPLPLDAYLACALTGLTQEQKQFMIHLSDTVANVCKNVGINLYEPRKKTDPVHNSNIQDDEVFRIDREKVASSDLLIHLCHFPSTGSGEELIIASDALVPIVLISHEDNRVSRMITGIPGFKVRITYTEPEEMRRDLLNCLSDIMPILEERKLAFSSYDANIVGNRIRELREAQGLTREEVAEKVPLLSIHQLRQIEESTDKISNPTLVQLRQIATVLKVTVSELIEPDLPSIVVTALDEVVNSRVAARFGEIPSKDKKSLLRRILYRILDRSEDE